MRKQTGVFFQISGAGHEALLLGLARHLRPGYDWFFPYYRDQRARARRSASRPTEMLLQAVGAADDPASGGRQMPCHWGDARPQHRQPDEPAPAASACPRSAARRRRATSAAARTCPGCVAHGDELTYVSLGEGATSRRRVLGVLNTACRLHLPVLYVVADNGYAISVPASRPGTRRRSRRWCAASGASRCTKIDGTRLLRGAAQGRPRSIAHVRAGVGPALDPRRRDPAVLALGRRHQSKYRAPRSWRPKPRDPMARSRPS